MKRLLLIICFVLLLPWVAHAADGSQWAKCGAASVAAAQDATNGWQAGADQNITKGESACFYFDGTENSDPFHVLTETALICLDPDQGSEGAANATVMIRHCHTGVTTYDANTCIEILDAALDGTVGSAATQNACVRVPRGTYAIRNVATASDDEAVVSIQGE
jgi:hypothetical protein